MHRLRSMPAAEFSITCVDPSIAARLLGASLVANTVRAIHNTGAIVYRGSSSTDSLGRHRHGFILEFASANAAGLLANWMWTALHGHVSAIEVGGETVPVQNAAIKRALLTHVIE